VRQVDITREVCPMTYVRTKLALEPLGEGELLEVLLKGEEPLRNVPKSAREEGHQVVSMTERPDGVTALVLKKGS
jgi:tRNA 2-thiouridine synthesizing protein A